MPRDELAALRLEWSTWFALDRRRTDTGRLPQPADRLDDGTDMVSPNYFVLVDVDAAGFSRRAARLVRRPVGSRIISAAGPRALGTHTVRRRCLIAGLLVELLPCGSPGLAGW